MDPFVCFITPLFIKKNYLVKKKEPSSFSRFSKKRFFSVLNMNDREKKNKIESEKILFEGPPSKLELVIPFISILTVIGIIPFFCYVITAVLGPI
mmetsp:Transcript_9299/g.18600  ORF Transcript_9299/g.18600 Transcript_9299/m.18600 type:complete len:95 (-) Transcript_9299:4255-4539(-)